MRFTVVPVQYPVPSTQYPVPVPIPSHAFSAQSIDANFLVVMCDDDMQGIGSEVQIAPVPGNLN